MPRLNAGPCSGRAAAVQGGIVETSRSTPSSPGLPCHLWVGYVSDSTGDGQTDWRLDAGIAVGRAPDGPAHPD